MPPKRKLGAPSLAQQEIAEKKARKAAGLPPRKPGPRPGTVQTTESNRSYIRVSSKTADLLTDTDWDSWDDEELRRGQRRAAGGRFVGRPPAIIPRGAYDELVRRTIDQCMETMRESMPALINQLVEMAKDKTITPTDRIKITSMFMDRIFGKPVERKSVAVSTGPAKWEGALDVAIVNDEEIE